MSQSHKILKRCLQLANSSVVKGNHPFGAVLLLDGKIVCEAENEVETMKDVTAHAEIRLIKKAQKILTKEQLKMCTLYTSTEPCSMCSGAIYWAGIDKVVFGCSTSQLNKIVGGSLSMKASEVLNSGTREIEISDLSDDSSYQIPHREFWPTFNP